MSLGMSLGPTSRFANARSATSRVSSPRNTSSTGSRPSERTKLTLRTNALERVDLLELV